MHSIFGFVIYVHVDRMPHTFGWHPVNSFKRKKTHQSKELCFAIKFWVRFNDETKQNKTKNTQIRIQSSEKCSQNSPQISKIVFWLFVSLSPMIASCDTRSRECFTHVSNCAEYFLPCKIYTRTISKLTQ